MDKDNDGGTAKKSEAGDATSKASQTSGNREESMGKADQDAFGKQSSAKSGTTPLGGGSPDADEKSGPGGVEGVSDNS